MTSRLLVSVLLAALSSIPALASAANHAKPAFDMSKVAVPTHAALAAKAGAHANERASAAPMTLEQFVGAKRATIQKLNDRQIAYLKRLIQLASADDPKLPDYWFRLGELYFEKVRYFQHEARSLDEPIFRAEQGENATETVPVGDSARAGYGSTGGSGGPQL